MSSSSGLADNALPARPSRPKLPRLAAAVTAMKEGRRGDAVMGALAVLERDSLDDAARVRALRILYANGFARLVLALSEGVTAEGELTSPLLLMRARAFRDLRSMEQMNAALDAALAAGARASEVEKIRESVNTPKPRSSPEPRPA